MTGNSRITLLGDAAHPMSPFKGQGANQALIDAVLLGESLTLLFQQTNPNVYDCLKDYEKQMYLRSDKKVTDSRDVAVRLHSASPLLDPATRGISIPLLEMFTARQLSAGVADLREEVLKCVQELKEKEEEEKKQKK
jgi:2-polyprenyl-6-methoxyphenol hydroxylase-like FAD-dependent oxidoreductase